MSDENKNSPSIAPSSLPVNAPVNVPVQESDAQKTTSDPMSDLNAKLDFLMGRMQKFEAQKTAPSTDKHPMPPDEAAVRLQALEQKITTRQKNIAVREAILSTGVDASGVEVFSALLNQRHGERVRVSGDDSVVVVDDLDREIPIGTFVKNFIADSKIADRFIPAKNLPGGKGLRGGGDAPPTSDVMRMPISELQKMSSAQIQSLILNRA